MANSKIPLMGNCRYRQYYAIDAGTITHNLESPSGTASFMVIATCVATSNQTTKANAIYIGYCTANAAFNFAVEVYSAANNETTVTTDANQIKITTTTNYVRVTVIEFERNT